MIIADIILFFLLAFAFVFSFYMETGKIRLKNHIMCVVGYIPVTAVIIIFHYVGISYAVKYPGTIITLLFVNQVWMFLDGRKNRKKINAGNKVS